MARATVEPNSFRLIKTRNKETGEVREYGHYRAWGRNYWSADLGKSWWTTRKEARNAAK